MDSDAARALGAEITKINFLLANLYAFEFKGWGLTHDQVPTIADELCRQSRLLGTAWGAAPFESEQAAQRELVEYRIAQFFAQVQERLRSTKDL